MDDIAAAWSRLRMSVKLVTIETKLATMRFRIETLLRSYDPNQPRVPAGSPDLRSKRQWL